MFNKINKTLKTWNDRKLEWFIKKFKYNRIKKTSKAKSKDSNSQKDSKSKKDSDSKDNSQKARSFTIYLSFILNQDEYKLYNAQMLDNTLDIYVCNDLDWSEFSKTRDAIHKDKLFTGKILYTIEAFGMVTINV